RGDDFAVGPTTAGWGWRCADLVTAETKERVCVDTPRQAYAWPVGDRVFLVGGDALQLLDGRTIEPEQEGRFAVIEILPGEHPYESFESPDFCRRWEIVQAIRAYTPERFGWGNDSCILDEYAASTMIDTTGQQFYGFARKIDGEWTFLQMVPAAEFLGCDQLDPPAREVCSAG
ncbi:MAG: hypothetical protein KDB17_06115, partial [Ilumatobacter sp.]|nr:hypothetical protein [Ilumatobacter sp.]